VLRGRQSRPSPIAVAIASGCLANVKEAGARHEIHGPRVDLSIFHSNRPDNIRCPPSSRTTHSGLRDYSWWHRLNAARTLPTVARIRTNRSVRVCEAKRNSVMLTTAGADGARFRVVERLADLTPQPNGRGGLRRYDQNERVGHLGPAGELPGLTDGTRHAHGDSDRMSCVIKILPVASGSKSDS
jgi:hypothetical protein